MIDLFYLNQEVASRRSMELYMDIQGNEPLIKSDTILQAILLFMRKKNLSVHVINLMRWVKTFPYPVYFTIYKA